MNEEERNKEIERLRAIGKKGGISTRRKRGKKYFAELGSRGGKSRWKKI